MPADYEKLGVFYIGKRYDPATSTRGETVLYEAKDLVTHAVCVGMTGSGKTGLGITLIEEAAIDGVPVLAIDPKGDLSNLLLTFPGLAPADFTPWVDPADAAARGMSVDALGAVQADAWQKGLAAWEQDGARVGRLRDAARVRVYTPGSRAGTPLALLSALQAPADEEDEDARARVANTAAGLLALAGLSEVAPHDREQALVSAILSAPAQPGVRADLPWLVQQIQRPPFDRVGVLDLETFYPAKDRQELALRFNSVLASPGFDVWLNGAPLDVSSMLYDEQGRPRVAIVSIAHLNDDERMLVVSLLLNATLAWTRRQTGTGSLRALVYMDEVFGYLPPVRNPPSKLPLLTLLKQARAFGVGIVLATQNPVDLDYKALSNTGTWFLGKLQTERDKARVLDGLEGVTSGLDREALDRALSGLKGRVFLLHNVHEAGPILFETRWALSYLRGPMSRDELRRAQGAAAGAATGASPSAGHDTGGTPSSVPGATVPTAGSAAAAHAGMAKPILPASIREYYFPGADRAGTLTPVLYGSARIHYTDAKRNLDTVQDLDVVVPFSDGAVAVNWDRAEPAKAAPDDLQTAGPAAGDSPSYDPLPPAALNAKQYAAWTKDFEQWILRAERLQNFSAPGLKMTSGAGESERDFRVRLRQAGREARDAAIEKLRAKYAPRLARLLQRAQSAQDAVAREAEQAQQQKTQTAVSFGATVLGALFGRSPVSLSTLGRATTAVRGVGRSMKETQDVARAQDKSAAAQAELQALEAELQEEIAVLVATDPAEADLEMLEIKPRRGSVDVRLVALAWKPRP